MKSTAKIVLLLVGLLVVMRLRSGSSASSPASDLARRQALDQLAVLNQQAPWGTVLGDATGKPWGYTNPNFKLPVPL